MKKSQPHFLLYPLLFLCLVTAGIRPCLGAAEDFLFAEGTPYASPGFVIKSGEEGPRIVCVGRPGGNAEAGEWLETLRKETLDRGELIVIPAYSVPEGTDSKALRYGFPKKKGAEISLEAARVFWEHLLALKPTAVIELGRGKTPRASTESKKAYGNTILQNGAADAGDLRNAAVRAANFLVRDPSLRWQGLSRPAAGGLTRSLADDADIAALLVLPADTGVEAGTLQSQTLAAIRGVLVASGLQPRPTVDHAALGAGKFRVAVFLDQGVFGQGPWNIFSEMEKGPDSYVAFVDAEDIRNGVLEHFDVAVFPGGSATGQGRSLGEEGRRKVVDFVGRGGGYFGICAGAYLGSSTTRPGGSGARLGLINAKTKSPKWRRGKGRVDLEIAPEGLEILQPIDSRFDVRYANGPILEPAGIATLPPYKTLASFRTELAGHGAPKGIMVDAPAFLAGTFGQGRAILFSPHPESDEDLRYLVKQAINWVAEKSEPTAEGQDSGAAKN